MIDRDFLRKHVIALILIIGIGIESIVLSVLLVNFVQISSNLQDLKDQKQILEDQLADLQEQNQTLLDQIEDLEKEYEIETTLRIGNSLVSYYDSLRDYIGSFSNSQEKVDFVANLGLHDLRRKYWPSTEDDYYNIIGEYSYDTARDKIDEIIALIEIEATDSTTEKIEKILDFIVKYITYEPEIDEFLCAPVETLGFKSGDCDDFSNLGATLFEAVQIDSAIGFFSNNQSEYHAMALVHLDSLSGYGYWHYDDLTSYGFSLIPPIFRNPW